MSRMIVFIISNPTRNMDGLKYCFQALSIVSHEGEAEDVLTGLRQKTQYGRPNWEHVFRDVAQVHAG